MSEPLILAVDQGTTGTTVLAFDALGQVRRRAYAEFPQIYPQPGWVEHDPLVIWHTTLALIQQAVQPGDTIVAVGITNQRETTVVWDRDTGQPIHNAIVWQCRRTSPLCRELAEHAPLFRDRTGLVLDAYFSGTKIRWLLDNVPGARARAAAGKLLFGTIDSWLIWQLTGGEVHVTDYTNASRTLIYDIYQKRWDPELLKLLQIPAALLPKVVPSSGVLGLAKVAPLQGVPIAGVAGDQQASLYGHHCFEQGLVKNTYGTGCFMMKYMGQQRVAPRHGLLVTLACAPDGQPVYALEGSVFIAGAAVQWLRDGMGLIESAAETEALARSVADNGGVYFVPAFVGLGAPYWDAEARGTVVGLTAGTGRAHLVRATLEAIAYQSRDVLEAMSATSGLPIRELRADGGAARNPFLMQFQADQLDIAVLRAHEVEKTAYGAALLAGRAVNFWTHFNPSEAPQGDLFLPNMPAADRDRLFQGWKAAVARARANP